MNGAAAFPCPRSEAVLALHLDGDLAEAADGDVGGYTFVDGASLHEHLRHCAACQTALRRARRLDAVLATAAGSGHATAALRPGASLTTLAERWFAVVEDLPRRRPPAVEAALRSPAGQRTRWPWLAVVAAAAGLLAWLALGAGGATATAVAPLRSDAPAIAASGGAARATAPPALAAAADGASAPLLRGGPGAFAQLRGRPDADQRPDTTPVALARRITAADRAADERHRALGLLLATSRPSAPAPRAAHLALVDALAACGDSSPEELAVHRDLLAAVRGARDTLHLLGLDLLTRDVPGARLQRDDFATLAVAARVGDDDLDRHLRRLARRHADAGAVIAAALRCGVREHGAARLLLDLWHDRDAVIGPTAATTVALAWFRGQAAHTFAELAAELTTSRLAPRRERCLLALGEARDTDSVAVLLAHTRSPHRTEAHTAAFALGTLPTTALADVVGPSVAPDAYLLRAALARADHPAARGWIQSLGLSAAERDRLHRGTCADFPTVAAWFRDASGAAD